MLPGGNGKLLVDAGIPGTRVEITRALAALSDDPIRHLINTHWHFDHTDGNEWLHAYAPAHTDSDVSVQFVEADVLHAGDTWWNGVYPFIDRSTGGSIDGMIRATEKNLAQVTAKTIIIPGHGPVGDRAQLLEYRDMLTEIRSRIATLKRQGRTQQEVLSAKPTASYDEKWGHLGFQGPGCQSVFRRARTSAALS